MEPLSAPIEKELPPIPPPTLRPLPSPISKGLNVVARQHRGRLIRHFISELVPLPSPSGYPDDEAGVEAWAVAMECALDELDQCIARGDWLSGVLKRRRKLARGSRQTEQQVDHSKGASATNHSSPIATLRGLASSFQQPDAFKRREAKHIVLCLAPASDNRRGTTVLPNEDLGFDIISDVVRRPFCSFRVGIFVLPNDDGKEQYDDSQGCVLYGLREWEEWCDAFPTLPLPLLAGGTFTIQNAISTTQRQAVAAVLRIAIYVHLSLVLEQELLQDIGIKLDFTPLPEHPYLLPNSAPAQEQPLSRRTSVGANIRRGLISVLGSKQLRRFGSLTSRAGVTMNPPSTAPVAPDFEQLRTGGSFDLSRTSSFRIGHRHAERESSMSTESSATPVQSRLHRFSLRGHGDRSSNAADKANQGNRYHRVSMTELLEKLNQEKDLLSSSPSVSIPPPPLVVGLAEKERLDTSKGSSQTPVGPKRRRRLNGEEKVGLSSLLGWESRSMPGAFLDSRNRPTGTLRHVLMQKPKKGQGMTGVGGFLRQQGLEVVLSRHVPCCADMKGSRSSISSKRDSVENGEGDQNDLADSSTITYTPCGRPVSLTFRYYGEVEEDDAGQDGEGDVELEDRPLGDAILSLVEEASRECTGRCEALEWKRDEGSFISRKRKRRKQVNLEGSESSRTSNNGTITSNATAETVTSVGTTSSASTAIPSTPMEDDLRSVAATTAAKERKLKKERERYKCPAKQGVHEIRLVHGESCVSITMDGDDSLDKQGADQDWEQLDLAIWSSCAICGATLAKKPLSDGAALFSFAKFIELLIYSSAFDKIDGDLCEHMSSLTDATEKNYNILHHFSAQTSAAHLPRTITFRVSRISDRVYDLRVPQLQVDNNKWDSSQTNVVMGAESGEEKKVLRKQIKTWWEGVSDHLDALEKVLTTSDNALHVPGFGKTLPRIPSIDDSYDYDDVLGDDSATPKATSTVHLTHTSINLPPSPPPSPNRFQGYFEKLRAHSPLSFGSSGDYFPKMPPKPPVKDTPPQAPDSVLQAPKPVVPEGSLVSSATPIVSVNSEPSTDTAQPSGSTTPKPLPPLVDATPKLLNSLREAFQRAEQDLYSKLSVTSDTNLNDVRRAFLSSARGAEKRLRVWQNKHLPSYTSSKLSCIEPEWFAAGCHALPGGSIIVRENDWGSMIAYTMSTPDYQRELFGMSIPRVGPPPTLSPLKLSSPHNVSPGEGSSSSSTSSFFSSASQRFFSFGTEAPPDPDREDIVWHQPEAYSAVVSRKDHPRDPSSLLSIRDVLRHKSPTETSSLSGFSSRAASRSSSHLPPPSAWSKPEVQVSMEAADGQVNGLLGSSDSSAGKKLLQIEATDPIPRPSSSAAGNIQAPSSTTSSVGLEAPILKRRTSSIFSTSSTDTERPDDEQLRLKIPPPKNPPKKESAPSGTFSNTLTNGISNAMRFVLSGAAEQDRIPSPIHHHGLLSTDSLPLDERPHIKYDWTLGKRLKFSCTVYYAKQFDSLRRRCGIEDIFLKSLSTSSNWAAEGGKSKSNFWKTNDDRFIIKTLVNAWNVADLQVLIEFCPSYFKYLESTATKPSVLAKLMGFYTIEIKNLETGAVQAKNDLLIMENLFCQQQITKTFDLKGIQGRKVRSSKPGNILFDGEWIEGQQRSQTYIRSHSKFVLREAIKSDAEFLAKSNIMDYSLLLGIDHEKKQLNCGLVDTIGSYTFAKTLEYKAKQGLSAGKEVTVIPPAEYQDRFVNALESYFVPCPDKWTKPLENTKVVTDIWSLPSVL